MSSYYRQQLEGWLKTLEVKADKVLDIGGSQLPVKDRVKSFDVKDYKILDLEVPHKGEKPDIVCDIECDCGTYVEDLNNYYIQNKKFDFDIIFCLEVAEYWFNPFQALKNINKLLKQNGTLYISFPFIYPHHNPVGEDCLRYTRWGVEKLLKESGFEIEQITPRVALKGSIQQFYSFEKMRPSKEYKGHNEIGYIVKAKKT
jgi:SAM-dependent methyltransferase